ncbi:NAD dependent epimerase/dehydratase family protein-like protein [Xylogone sp. PMI_703]|nr:NAD dependent epimerase/dehydratase family protein-like protein [Xylogone sp. PMI_703]
MTEKIYQVRNVGIYHGLPVYDPSITGLTAIVSGANGISGYHMVRVLAQSPQRWSKIYCLSRRPPLLPDGFPENAEHIPLDFLQDSEQIAAVLKEKNVRADYVFYFSYIHVQPKEGETRLQNTEEMCVVNTKILSNFLEVLPLADIKPKRIMLQTGVKTYGIHLGHALVPHEEADSRVTLEPVFYYPQEDYFWDYCKKHDIGWNICIPSFILGAVPDAAMNLGFPLAVYATITKYLGERLEYPGDMIAWENPQSQSTCMLNAYMEEWAVLTPEAQNQQFNTSDDSAFTWSKFWPKLAAKYEVEYTAPDPEYNYSELPNPYSTPPRGLGPNTSSHYKFTLTGRAHRPEVQAAWKELAAKYSLVDKELRDIPRIFSFADAALIWSQKIFVNGDKARALGWQGHVSSSDGIFEVFKDFEKIHMIPPVPK